MTAARDDTEPTAGAPHAGDVHVFISFDVEHDCELYERLVAQSRAPGSGFAVLGGSERATASDARSARARRRIAQADQVIVICGEHTDESIGVFDELRSAQEEDKSYFMLWGRRDTMCTKPMGAKRTEGMYSWTRQVLQEQLALTYRKARADAAVETVRVETRKNRPSPPASKS